MQYWVAVLASFLAPLPPVLVMYLRGVPLTNTIAYYVFARSALLSMYFGPLAPGALKSLALSFLAVATLHMPPLPAATFVALATAGGSITLNYELTRSVAYVVLDAAYYLTVFTVSLHVARKRVSPQHLVLVAFLAQSVTYDLRELLHILSSGNTKFILEHYVITPKALLFLYFTPAIRFDAKRVTVYATASSILEYLVVKYVLPKPLELALIIGARLASLLAARAYAQSATVVEAG